MRFVRALGAPPDAIDLDAIGDAVAHYPVSIVVVFGSQATGDAGPLSDLDVAIEFNDDVTHDEKRRLLDELQVAVQDAAGIEAVDLVDLDTASPIIGYAALSRGRLVHGDPSVATDREVALMLRALDFQHVREEWGDALSERIREGRFARP